MTTTTLRGLGWSAHFQSQLEIDEIGRLEPRRVAAVHRSAADLLSPEDVRRVELPAALATDGIAVGDWLLTEGPDALPVRLLARKSLIQRRAAGTGRGVQPIAANIDTLFVVSSCNADFNPARLERYLVLARQAGVLPVIVLTRADLCDDAGAFLERVREVAPTVAAEAVDARDPGDRARLLAWCGPGETVALVGSSGVGKSTLTSGFANTVLATEEIRADDAKGRHTTTARSMHRMPTGVWLIDTPGMRALRLYDAAEGVDAVFADVAALAYTCRFSDCRHEDEPGCAVQAAIEAGELAPERLARWQKLAREETRNTASIAQQRRGARALGRFYKAAQKGARDRKGR